MEVSLLKRKIQFSAWAICCLLLFTGRPVSSAQDNFSRWLTGLKKQALSEGISEKTLAIALADVKPNDLVIKLDRNQPEFKLTFDEYLHRVMPQVKIRIGREKLHENYKLLYEVAEHFKVQPRFLIALWGIETDFGRVTGSLPVVESLVTLAYDPRRSAFFRQELLASLHIIDRGWLTNAELRGSWAGAFGGLQFLPSVFLKYAVDFDNDHRIDPWHDKDDLLASGANYLAKSGWRFDETWGREVLLPPGFDRKLADLGCKKKISYWQALGVRRLNGHDLPTRDLESSIIIPEGSRRAFMVYKNFEVLLKWNHAVYYGLAAGLLSDKLGHGYLKIKNRLVTAEAGRCCKKKKIN